MANSELENKLNEIKHLIAYYEDSIRKLEEERRHIVTMLTGEVF